MEVIKEMYRTAYREHGDNHKAVLWPKGRQEQRWEALTRHFDKRHANQILDYGCGLAHMEPWLRRRHPQLLYHGADMVPEFIEHGKKKYANCLKFWEVTDPKDIPEDLFKYIVVSGVFNIKYAKNEEDHWEMVKNILRGLWVKTRDALSVDFMHTMVDYQQPHSYHQDPKVLLEFLRQEMSPLVRLDFSYLPYEFAAIVFRPL